MWKFLLLIFGLIKGFQCQSATTLNVLFINEIGNDAAKNAVDEAIKLIKDEDVTLNVKTSYIEGTAGKNSRSFLESICKKLNESIENKAPPVMILDTTKTVSSTKVVKAMSDALKIATVSASHVIFNNSAKHYFQITHPADTLMQIIKDIVRFKRYSSIAILYDESFVTDNRYKVLLKGITANYIMTAIANDEERPNQFKKLTEDLKIVNFFILGTNETIKMVLETTKKEHFHGKFTWHAISLTETKLTLKLDNATIVFIHPIVTEDYNKALEPIETKFNLKSKSRIESSFYFNLAYRTFLAMKLLLTAGLPFQLTPLKCSDYNGKNSPNNSIDILNALLLKTDEHYIYASFYYPDNKTTTRQGFMEFKAQINEVHILKGEVAKNNQIGLWKAGKNTLAMKQEVKNGTTKYHIYTVVQPPFIMRDQKSPKGFKGFCIDMIDEIAKIVNFDYDIQEVEDGKFGDINDNGQWDGVVAKLINQEADIGLGAMWKMSEREMVIDYTMPFYELVGISILIQKKKAESSLFKFLDVLENEVWFCILGAYLLTSLLLWIYDRYSPYSYQNNREKYENDEEKRIFTFKESLWFCMTSLTPHGGGEAPKSLSGRILSATWWLFGFIIIASYTANLAAFLTVSRLDQDFGSLEELAGQYKFEYAPLNGSATMKYFQRMSNIESRFYEIWKEMSLNDSLSHVERSKLAVWDYPVSDRYTKMWQAMQEFGLQNNMDEVMFKLRGGNFSKAFAFLSDAAHLRYLVLTNCDMQMIDDEFSKKPYAIGLQKNSPLKWKFDRAILQLIKNRQLDKMKEKWWNHIDETSKCNFGEQLEGITIQNSAGVFIVVFVGILISFIILIFEYFYYKYVRKYMIFKCKTDFLKKLKKSRLGIKKIKTTLNPEIQN